MKKIILAMLLAFTPSLIFAETASEEQILNLIQKVLKEKPELVKQALIAEREKEQKKIVAAQNNVIKEHRNELFNGKLDYRAGNPKGDVTIAMLHDFRCGHCKSAHQRIESFLKDEKNVNVIFKDYPILGHDSKFAARAALAAKLQSPEKQKALIHKITYNSGRIDDDDVIEFAKKVGLNVTKLKDDMDSRQVWRELGNTKTAARKMGIRSTPTFIISAKGKEQVIPGVLEKSDLMEIVAKARKA